MLHFSRAVDDDTHSVIQTSIGVVLYLLNTDGVAITRNRKLLIFSF